MICAVSYPTVRVYKVNNIGFKGYQTIEHLKIIATNLKENEASKKLDCLWRIYTIYGKTQKDEAIKAVQLIKKCYQEEKAQKALPHGWESMISDCNEILKLLGVEL